MHYKPNTSLCTSIFSKQTPPIFFRTHTNLLDRRTPPFFSLCFKQGNAIQFLPNTTHIWQIQFLYIFNLWAVRFLFLLFGATFFLDTTFSRSFLVQWTNTNSSGGRPSRAIVISPSRPRWELLWISSQIFTGM